MRIGLITTLDTNIGDDLVRKGICRVLGKVFNHHELAYVPVNKHQPFSVYPRWHPVHIRKLCTYLPRARTRVRCLIDKVTGLLPMSLFDSCDFIVQCGAPVFWAGCHRCEWAGPIWHRVIGRLHRRIPVLNLAAGTCYPWERQPEAIRDPGDVHYLRSIIGYCKATTVRDELAQRLCRSLGVHAPLIPCSAFLAADDSQSDASKSDLIVISYMAGGGHYDWDQGIDADQWQRTVKALIGRLRRRHRVAFLCHSEKEFKLAKQMDSTLPRIWPKNAREYFDVVPSAAAGVCNRLHASVALASLGIPSVAVGTDTRLLMVKALGLPYVYVKEATPEGVEFLVESLVRCRDEERERLLALKRRAWSLYIDVVRGAIGS